jgi:hypothetical protein
MAAISDRVYKLTASEGPRILTSPVFEYCDHLKGVIIIAKPGSSPNLAGKSQPARPSRKRTNENAVKVLKSNRRKRLIRRNYTAPQSMSFNKSSISQTVFDRPAAIAGVILRVE